MHQELSNLEVPPDAKLVVNIYLPNWHPLVVSADGSQLSVCEAGPGRREGAPRNGVVRVCRSCFLRAIGNLKHNSEVSVGFRPALLTS